MSLPFSKSISVNKSEIEKNSTGDLANRLVRIETRLVRGFEELGINIDSDDQWFFIDDINKTITLKTLGRSFKVLQNLVNKPDKTAKIPYSLYFKNELFGQILVSR